MFLGTLRTSIDLLDYRKGEEDKREAQRTAPRQLDKVQLLALLWPRDVRRDEGVHEGLKVGPPPLRERVADLPLVVDALACELRADGREALVQPRLEAFDLFDVVR